MADKIYDVIIIGGGPAGLTAGIYTSREGLSTLLLEKGICGGWTAVTDLIENYPGFPNGVKGFDLAQKFKEQAKRFGTEIAEGKDVKNIKKTNENVVIETSIARYACRALILASGTLVKKLNIPGETEFTGKGVSYCATCDGPLFRGKDIMVVGGGNAAAEEALFLTNFARKVTLVHRRLQLRAAKILEENLRKNSRIEFLLNHIPISINGKQNVDSVTVENKQTKRQKEIAVSGVFIYIGFLPNSSVLEGIIDLDEEGYVRTDEKMQTSIPGIFAAGDVRSKGVRQVVTACAEGAIAAMSVRDYLK